ncbi:hypothetical protein CEXT_597151 [Caerostris extrusa]|uniref:Uncharacterized protein n=1 Tax=Caerostris extrusa TaxID=172846 RepID=A0AAV4U8C0_CAEEX|nr:hypothetical protein CEXT_597151 [Caerostris extrusa]
MTVGLPSKRPSSKGRFPLGTNLKVDFPLGANLKVDFPLGANLKVDFPLGTNLKRLCIFLRRSFSVVLKDVKINFKIGELNPPRSLFVVVFGAVVMNIFLCVKACPQKLNGYIHLITESELAKSDFGVWPRFDTGDALLDSLRVRTFFLFLSQKNVLCKKLKEERKLPLECDFPS